MEYLLVNSNLSLPNLATHASAEHFSIDTTSDQINYQLNFSTAIDYKWSKDSIDTKLLAKIGNVMDFTFIQIVRSFRKFILKI